MPDTARKPLRLKSYDYSQTGAYFITICAFGRLPIFGNIKQDSECVLSTIGKIIDKEILALEHSFTMITVEKYVIMPNHVHMIVMIGERKGNKNLTLGDIICTFKSKTTISANKADRTPGRKIWQYRYHDHIIRTEDDFIRIYKYIQENPAKWIEDRYYHEINEFAITPIPKP